MYARASAPAAVTALLLLRGETIGSAAPATFNLAFGVFMLAPFIGDTRFPFSTKRASTLTTRIQGLIRTTGKKSDRQNATGTGPQGRSSQMCRALSRIFVMDQDFGVSERQQECKNLRQAILPALTS
jgi:hypothetical protein